MRLTTLASLLTGLADDVHTVGLVFCRLESGKEEERKMKGNKRKDSVIDDRDSATSMDSIGFSGFQQCRTKDFLDFWLRFLCQATGDRLIFRKCNEMRGLLEEEEGYSYRMHVHVVLLVINNYSLFVIHSSIINAFYIMI